MQIYAVADTHTQAHPTRVAPRPSSAQTHHPRSPTVALPGFAPTPQTKP